MAPPEAASILWFVQYMGLPNVGIIPSVTPTEYLPSREALADFFGPKVNSGYTFDNFGDLMYEAYVMELYTRVLQVEWPANGVVTFHFARGLMSEAMDVDVNWAEFGFKMTHPHQSRSKGTRVLPLFENLDRPLPPLSKIVPRTRFNQVISPPSPHSACSLLALSPLLDCKSVT